MNMWKLDSAAVIIAALMSRTHGWLQTLLLPLFSSCVVQLLRQEQHAAMKSNEKQRDLPWNDFYLTSTAKLFIWASSQRSVVPRESSSFHCTDIWLIVMTGRSERPNLFTWQITLCTLNLLCNLKTQNTSRKWKKSINRPQRWCAYSDIEELSVEPYESRFFKVVVRLRHGSGSFIF